MQNMVITCTCVNFDAENGTSFVKLKTKEPHTGQFLLASQCVFSWQYTMAEGAYALWMLLKMRFLGAFEVEKGGWLSM